MGGSSEGVNSMAMQQGGLGLILTMLIISAPPMAATFFQGVLGSFNAQNAFFNTGASGSNRGQPGVQPGYPGYVPPTNTSRPDVTVPPEHMHKYAGTTQAPASSHVKNAGDARLGNAGYV